MDNEITERPLLAQDHTAKCRQTSIHNSEFKSVIPVFDWPKTMYGLDIMATGSDFLHVLLCTFKVHPMTTIRIYK
jgi:hypothetical protein